LLIVNNESLVFQLQKKTDADFSLRYKTSMKYFADCFYTRLFDVHPTCRHLFRDITAQGKFLVKMITVALTELDHQKQFEELLIHLAEIHNQRS
jgi:hemoglobin-like flavoprotein